MNESMRRTFDMGTESQSKYYGVPTLASLSGIVYDVDLFEDEKLYFGEGSTASRPVWTGRKTNPQVWTGKKALMTTDCPKHGNN